MVAEKSFFDQFNTVADTSGDGFFEQFETVKQTAMPSPDLSEKENVAMLKLDKQVYDDLKAKGLSDKQIGRIAREKEKENTGLSKAIRFVGNAVGIEGKEYSQLLEDQYLGGKNATVAALGQIAKSSPEVIGNLAPLFIPVGAGPIGIAKSAAAVGGLVAASDTAQNLIDGEPVSEAIENGLKKGGTAAALEGTAATGMKLLGLGFKTGRALSPVKLTRREFKNAAKATLNAGEEVSEHFMNNSKRILADKGLESNKVLDDMAIKLKESIASKKSAIGKDIEKAASKISASNKTANVQDVIDGLKQIVGTKEQAGLLTKSFADDEIKVINDLIADLSADNGKISYSKIDALRKAINDKTTTSTGRPIIGELQTILKRTRNSIVDKIDDAAYKKANADYAQLANLSAASFGDRKVFDYAARPEISKEGIDVINKIRNNLLKIGQERGRLAVDAISEPGKKALRQLDSILPGYSDTYSKALDYNAYNTFNAPMRVNSIKDLFQAGRQQALLGTATLPAYTEPLVNLGSKLIPAEIAGRRLLQGQLIQQ